MKELIKIQTELKSPKNQYNKFGKYNYRSCEDILEAVKPLLNKYECLMTISDKIVGIEGSAYVESTVTIKSSEGSESVTAYAKHPSQQAGMSDSQITGSSSSYARKYALNGLFLIDDTKDADATNTHNSKKIVKDWGNLVKYVQGGGDKERIKEEYSLNKEQLETLESL